ncbi:glycerophosphodiester phosphodiesterase family protein [Butyrivibrio sp. VCD2006]|uniref:glycerophosphodiester phosphodiesterase family protein n=1 Tax=Butyrivibrio sp. VCD2006 TaxID=1280664 RepID=UPI000478EF93|nr:glycerophosphodiester phosphodiesterase family protein [Butyrivibrio sp. VCD2006]
MNKPEKAATFALTSSYGISLLKSDVLSFLFALTNHFTKDNIKKRVAIEAAVVVIGALVVAVLVFSNFPFGIGTGVKFSDEDRAEIEYVREALAAEGHIVHAAGFITKADGETVNYTSSVEALNNCYANGNMFCELDFLKTTDGKLVCAHSWKQFYDNGEALTEAVSLEKALSCKIEGEFTPLELSTLVDFLRGHENFYIVTDIKKDYNVEGAKLIAEAAPDMMDRFIIQVYHEQEAGEMEAMGFKNIIFTLYRTEEEERTPEAIEYAAKHHDFIAWTAKKSFISKEFAEEIKKNGGILFTHTINDPEEMKQYIAEGVDGFYSDVASWDEVKKELENGK